MCQQCCVGTDSGFQNVNGEGEGRLEEQEAAEVSRDLPDRPLTGSEPRFQHDLFTSTVKIVKIPPPGSDVHAHVASQHLLLLHPLQDGPVAVGRAVPVVPPLYRLVRVVCDRGQYALLEVSEDKES